MPFQQISYDETFPRKSQNKDYSQRARQDGYNVYPRGCKSPPKDYGQGRYPGQVDRPRVFPATAARYAPEREYVPVVVGGKDMDLRGDPGLRRPMIQMGRRPETTAFGRFGRGHSRGQGVPLVRPYYRP